MTIKVSDNKCQDYFSFKKQTWVFNKIGFNINIETISTISEKSVTINLKTIWDKLFILVTGLNNIYYFQRQLPRTAE